MVTALTFAGTCTARPSDPSRPHRPPRRRTAAGTALLAMPLLAISATAHADVTLYEQNGLTFEGGLTAGLGAVAVTNANLGAGVVTPDGKVQKDRSWAEGYVAPSLKLTYASEGAGTLYGGVRAVSGGTVGDGDAGGFTQGRQGRTDLDNLYVGWKSGDLLSALGKDAVDLSYGRQNFMIGDGFIIGTVYNDVSVDALRRLGVPDSAMENSPTLDDAQRKLMAGRISAVINTDVGMKWFLHSHGYDFSAVKAVMPMPDMGAYYYALNPDMDPAVAGKLQSGLEAALRNKALAEILDSYLVAGGPSRFAPVR